MTTTEATDQRLPFVGRREALERLVTALSRAREGRPTTALVSGEPGIGKSTLIEQFRRLTPNATFIIGNCLNLGDAPSYAPFVGILRSLVRRIGLDHLRASLPANIVSALAWLLPDFADPLPTYEGTRARMFDAFLTLLESLTQDMPLVLMIEDVHWADQSTWDLLTYVVNNADDTRLLTIITYRDLPIGHPLRGPVSELGRHHHVVKVELRGLGRADVALQSTTILGRPPDSALLNDIMRRSGGNPFFVEAILDHSGAGEPSGSIRDLLIAPIERLPGPTQRVLHIVAVGGSEVGHTVLGKVAGISDEDLDEALRPAVHEGVLLTTQDGYRFRHALIAEAVHDVLLLPGERRRLHRRYAEAIDEDPRLAPPVMCHAAGEVARHWAAAGEPIPALVATWRAAQEGRDLLAHPERLQMLRRVLELWCLVDHPSEIIGVSRAAVLRDIVEAADESGDIELGMSIASAALEAAKSEDTPELAAQILERRARIRSRLAMGGATGDLEDALRLLPEDSLTPLRARLLGHLAHRLWVEGKNQAARSLAENALKVASDVGDAYSEAHATITLAGLAAQDGATWDGAAQDSATKTAMADFATARRLAEQHAVPMLVVTSHISESWVLETIGESARAADSARAGVRRAGEAGLARTLGVRLAGTLSESLLSLGEWDEALEVLAHAIDLEPPKGYRATILAIHGEILAARGNLASAEQVLDEIRGLSSGRFETAASQFTQATFEARLRLAQDDPGAALTAVLDAIEAFPVHRAPARAWPLLVTGARAYTKSEVQARPLTQSQLHTTPWEDTFAALRTAAAATAVKTDVDRAWSASFAAETAPRSRRCEVREAELAAWERLGRPYQLAWALVRYSEALLGKRNQTAAAELLHRAIGIAEALGAAPLIAAAGSMAARAHLSLAEEPTVRTPAPARSELGLTPREVEVLRLVTEGRTNRQIASELFISVKTAGVHVSRILMKTDAATRGEAAAKAHRLHLFDDPI
ncbi:AAA family ATPase [Nonomuraea sp. NPDC026600]|uniref:helix-turn-helix transcriptional regulator n=1 Tax=Nonomuraea sp. NPDC026600 TaxID=3155363 RepID=UPI0033C456D8